MALHLFRNAGDVDRAMARIGLTPRWRRDETLRFEFPSWGEAVRFALDAGVLAGYEAMFAGFSRESLGEEIARELEAEAAPPALELHAFAGLWEDGHG